MVSIAILGDHRIASPSSTFAAPRDYSIHEAISGHLHRLARRKSAKIGTYVGVVDYEIIVAVVAFSSGSLATIAIYAQSPPVSVICSVVLAFVVYLALRFSPR